jgi:hypothetical protein
MTITLGGSQYQRGGTPTALGFTPQVGSILVAFAHYRDGGTGNTVSGWTKRSEVVNSGSFRDSTTIYTRVADGTETYVPDPYVGSGYASLVDVIEVRGVTITGILTDASAVVSNPPTYTAVGSLSRPSGDMIFLAGYDIGGDGAAASGWTQASGYTSYFASGGVAHPCAGSSYKIYTGASSGTEAPTFQANSDGGNYHSGGIVMLLAESVAGIRSHGFIIG